MANRGNAGVAGRTAPREGWLPRRALKWHLSLALGAGVFYLILGFTGAVIAFEQEIPRWSNPHVSFVQPGATILPQQQLVADVERAYAPDRVRAITLATSAGVSEMMLIAPPGRVTPAQERRAFVDQYTGAVLGTLPLHTGLENVVQELHSIHLRLTGGKAMQVVVSLAGLTLCVELVFGLLVWFRLKRAQVKWSGSHFRKIFDLHNVVGVYAVVFLLIMAVTGTTIGFEDFFLADWIYAATGTTEPAPPPRELHSTPAEGAAPISVDQAIQAAGEALPGTSLEMVQLPANPRGVYMVRRRVPGETAPAVMSYVLIDQFSGQPLYVHAINRGQSVIRFIRSVHTGDVFGLAGHILASLWSLILVMMIATGVIIWRKKLVT